MVFSEKHKPSYVPVHHQYTQVMRGAGWPIPMQVGGGMTFGMAPMGMNHISTSMGDVAMTASASASNTSNPPSTKSISPGVSYQETEASYVAPVEQTLGTAFGEATNFGTTEITFNRGDLSALIVMYYDDSRGLIKRGIQLRKPSRIETKQPQAFPAMTKNCVPPAGWTG
jgi:hypothetical protein